MQGRTHIGVPGATIRRGFAGSRYEASYLQEAYDLLVQLGRRPANPSANVSNENCVCSKHNTYATMRCYHSEHNQQRSDHDQQASCSVCAGLV